MQTIIQTFFLAILVGCGSVYSQSEIPGDSPGFYHGVASGSPLPTQMIFWTRYTPFNATAEVEIEYRIAKVPTESPPDSEGGYEMLLDPAQNPEARYGKAMALPENDWIVKLDITGLEPDSKYVYGFTDGTVASKVGITKTPKANGEKLDKLTFAVFSCSNYPTGYFHAYDIGSTINDLDFWFHAGDYIYEYADGDCTGDRCWQPLAEIIELADYRLRYASYHLDEGLQNLRGSAPLISTWDDHETANNAGRTGAQAHDPTFEGPWEDRVKAATQAYFEWMPFRPGPGPMGPVEDASLTQTFEFGDLMTFVSLDTRVHARSVEPALAGNGFGPFLAFTPAFTNTETSAYCEEPLFSEFNTIADGIKKAQYNPEYTMIGDPQVEYIKDAFQKSNDEGKPWQVFGTATMMSKLVFPCLSLYGDFVEPQIAPFANMVLGAALGGTDDLSVVLRAICAMACTNTPTGQDDWNGYSVERAKLLQVFAENAANAIVLFGDSHDSWAFEMDADGSSEGPPVAINLGAPGVTSTGIGNTLAGLFQPIIDIATSSGVETTMDDLQKADDQQFMAQNDHLKYANLYNKGFYTVTLTHEESVTEFFHLDPSLLPMDFDSARQMSTETGGLTADFFCGVSLVSKPGEHTFTNKNCGTTEFITELPAYRNAQMNVGFMADPTMSPTPMEEATEAPADPTAAPVTSAPASTPAPADDGGIDFNNIWLYVGIIAAGLLVWAAFMAMNVGKFGSA